MNRTPWEFCSGFGVYDPKRNQWIEPLKETLLGAGRTENPVSK